MYQYTCDRCGTTSHQLSSQAEADQLLAVHEQVRHSNLNRSDPLPTREARDVPDGGRLVRAGS